MPPSLYDTLGVEKGASADDIRKSYFKLAKKHHPDKGGDPEKFKVIQAAYEILSDERRRTIYDHTGREDNSAVPDHAEGMPFGMGGPGGMPFGMPFGPGGPGGMPFGPGGPGGPGIPFDMGNIFGMFAQKGPGGGKPEKQQKAHKPAPKIHETPISLWDYFHGKQIRIQFERQKFCEGCKGSGADSYKSCGGCGGSGVKQQMVMVGPGMNMMMRGPCDECAGEGKRVASACKKCAGKKTKTQEKALDFKIEPGMRPGEVLRFPNECSDQVEFMEPGDVHIHLQEADEDIRFKRLGGGDDLAVKTQVGLKDALLGCKERMDGHPAHPEGLTVDIPVGVQNGEVIRIDGEGMPRKGGGRGALHVTVLVVASNAEKEMLVKGRNALEELFTSEG